MRLLIEGDRESERSVRELLHLRELLRLQSCGLRPRGKPRELGRWAPRLSPGPHLIPSLSAVG